jgi:PleD family two-component response regulator
VLAGQERTVHASIGIAARTLGHLAPEDILHDADLALYQAKERGRDRYAVYLPGSTEPARPGSAEPIRKAS